MEFESFLKFLKHEKRASPHTVRAYSDDLSRFFSYLRSAYGYTSVEDISHQHIRSWMVILSGDGLTARSINRKISCLKSYFKFLLRTKRIGKNPMQKVVAPKPSKRLPVFVEDGNMKKLFGRLEVTKGEEDRAPFSLLREQLILEMLYATGMRESELINICLRDMSPGCESIRVLGKRNKERIIPSGKSLASLVGKYLGERKSFFGKETGQGDFLFVTDKGTKLYPKYVYRVVRKYLDLVTTVEKRSPHVLRHTFATHLSNRGADLNAIKELLGHANLSATQVYTHNTIEKLKKIYRQAHPKA